MQVKVCPKCKAQNRPTSAACSNCYASLEAVPVIEGTAPPIATPAVTASPRPARTAAAPTQQMGVPQQTQMGVPQQTQMGPMSPPPGRPMPPGAYQMAPARKSPVGIIVLVLLIVCAAFGALIFVASKSGLFKSAPPPAESPAKAALQFLEAKRYEDLAKVEPYLSRNSVKMIRNTLSSKQAQSAGFTTKDAANMLLFDVPPTRAQMVGKQIAATEMKGDKDADSQTAIVHVVLDEKAEPAPAPKPLLPPGVTPPPEPEKHVDFSKLFDAGPVDMQYVLVAEDGHWKVDLDLTNRRQLGLGRPGNPFKLGN